jgi:septum formation topological specificity factor MinE
MTLMERVQQFLHGSGSKTDAKVRLLGIIGDDRLGLTAEEKEELKKEILAVIRKHVARKQVAIDADGFTMEFVHYPQKEIQMTAPMQRGEKAAVNGSE